MPTVTDFFCGAGGSSTGLHFAGFEVKHAANLCYNDGVTENKTALVLEAPAAVSDHSTKGTREMAEHDSITEKRCTKCGVLKPLSEFHKHKLGVGGVNPVCKACRSRAKPKPSVTPGMKRCTKCGTEYPPTTEHFYPNAMQRSGLRPECRHCQNQRVKLWAEQNRDALNRKARERHARNPSVRNEINRRSVNRYPSRSREIKRAWEQRNPRSKAQLVAKTARRLAAKRCLPSAFTAQDWECALKYFDNRCAVCGSPPGFWTFLAADHWVALSDPRPDNPGTVASNIVPLCHAKAGVPIGEPSCNVSKGAMDPVEWLTIRYGQAKA